MRHFRQCDASWVSASLSGSIKDAVVGADHERSLARRDLIGRASIFRVQARLVQHRGQCDSDDDDANYQYTQCRDYRLFHVTCFL